MLYIETHEELVPELDGEFKVGNLLEINKAREGLSLRSLGAWTRNGRKSVSTIMNQ